VSLPFLLLTHIDVKQIFSCAEGYSISRGFISGRRLAHWFTCLLFWAFTLYVLPCLNFF